MAFFGYNLAAAVFLLLIFAPVRSTMGATLAQERQALLDFKAAVKNPTAPFADFLKSWVGNGVCTNWTIIVCNNAGHVTNLEIWDLDPAFGGSEDSPVLDVDIGPTFAYLSFLQSFTIALKGNKFPAVLTSLKLLKLLYVQGASGTLPASIGNWGKMTDLTIVDGTVGGPIPRRIGNLTSIKNLELGRNKLIGFIPAEVGRLAATLEYFSVSTNNIGGYLPSTIGALRNLGWLYVDTNKLSGPIPASLGALTKLAFVEMSDNHFSGAIPLPFARLPNLYRFRATNNAFTGTVPAELNKVPQVFLDNNFLTGSVAVKNDVHTYSSNCLGITRCKHTVVGQRPFAQCLAKYPSLKLPCTL